MTASNTERARNRERPTCWNRPDYPDTQTVNDGWTWDGMLQITSVPNPMSKHCASWAVAKHENPAEEAIPARQGWRCLWCKHLPSDPRVLIRAAASELW